MRHARTGKKLGRDSAQRKALYSNLAGQLIEHGRIKTTITKAKAVKPLAEQMITLGRRGDIHSRRQAVAFLRSKDVVHKLFAEVAPRFADRPGGYSRIVKLGPRYGDAAEMVYLELVDGPVVFKTKLKPEVEEVAAAPAAEEAADEPAGEAETADAEASVAEEETVASEEAADDAVAEEAPVAEAEAAAEGDAEGEAEAPSA